MCVNLLKLQELSQPTTGPCGEANGLLRPTCERSPTAQHISEFFSFLFHFVFSNFFCYILSLINRFPAVCIFMCTKWLQILYLVRSQTQFDILTHFQQWMLLKRVSSFFKTLFINQFGQMFRQQNKLFERRTSIINFKNIRLHHHREKKNLRIILDMNIYYLGNLTCFITYSSN